VGNAIAFVYQKDWHKFHIILILCYAYVNFIAEINLVHSRSDLLLYGPD